MAADNGPPMTITMAVCAALSFVFMSLRFYCKLAPGTKIMVDDVVLAFSWALFMVFIIISIYSTKFGLGKHLGNLDLTRLPRLLYLLPIAQFFAVLSVAVSKTSFILTLLRLVNKTWHKVALWFMFVTVNASLLSISIVQFYQCPAGPAPKNCVSGDNVISLGVFAAGYSAVMDLVLTVFPSLIIWKLQMKTREKIGIIVSMSLGVVAGVVGIYKTSTIPNVSRSADFTHGTAIVLIWLVAEVTATIIAASIPLLRPLLRRYSRNRDESYGMSSRTNRGHSKLGSISKLGSQAVVQSDTPNDYSSDKDILGPSSRIVRKTNVTVEYDSYTADEERGQQKHGHEHRDIF